MDKETLKKYSYLVSGDTELSIGHGHMQGTGFFIKRGDNLYFVCAKHTLSGCNDNNIKDERTPNTMNIVAENYVIPIDAKPIKDSAPCLPIVLDPDIIVLPIKKNLVKREEVIHPVHSVETKMPDKYSELVIWGFPNDKNIITAFSASQFTILTDLYVEVKGKGYTDKIHYCIEVDKPVNEMAGFSGAPVFLKDAVSEAYVFIGILVGTHKTANGLYVVQPKYLDEKLNQF